MYLTQREQVAGSELAVAGGGGGIGVWGHLESALRRPQPSARPSCFPPSLSNNLLPYNPTIIIPGSPQGLNFRFIKPRNGF